MNRLEKSVERQPTEKQLRDERSPPVLCLTILAIVNDSLLVSAASPSRPEEKRRSHRSYGSPGKATLAERRDELNRESIIHKT
jgi:hypothetical protein